jgi:tetratricopeptide (TPR) repeat protein
MKNLGPRSSRVASTKMNLCLVYRELGELDTAQRYGEEALAVNAELFLPNHPMIAMSLCSLGKVAQKRGDRATARALYQRSIATYEASEGRRDRELGFTLRLLAQLSSDEGKTNEALRLHERALTERRKVLGEKHVEVGESWEDVARARLALSDSSGALEAARSCVSTYRSVGPAASARLPGGLLLLGDLLRRNGRAAEALPYLEEAHAIWSRNPPTVPKDRADLDAALAATRAALH